MQVKKERFEALDILRGLTIVIMALDHCRHFFALGFVYLEPTNVNITNLEVFFTRWITHFAAPTFIFLAGIGLYFASGRRTKSELAYLAISRGLWLIFLELTIVGYFWAFSPDFITHPKVGVLFAIGVSMISVGFLIYLPKYIIGLIALSMIFGHNLLDSITVDSFDNFGWIFQLLHAPGTIVFGDFELLVIYPFIPWIGVMAAGYLFGPVVKYQKQRRKKVFLSFGLGLIIFSLILRYTNLYGDPQIWTTYIPFDMTLISFLNFTKYPASLIYISFFIGIALLLMFAFDRKLGKWVEPLRDFGQAPFFFYILHIPLIHIMAIIFAYTMFGQADWLFGAPLGKNPEVLNYLSSELIPTYVSWITIVFLLYFPSKWFAKLKLRRKDWWLSYL